jgi:hypothetical protein
MTEPNGIPAFVVLEQGGALGFTPNELRLLKATTGKTLQDMDEADTTQVAVWVRLRREGHPEVTWEQCGDIEVRYVPADPQPSA